MPKLALKKKYGSDVEKKCKKAMDELKTAKDYQKGIKPIMDKSKKRERRDPPDAGVARDDRRDARPGRRGQLGVHRRLQPSRRVRVGRHCGVARAGRLGGARTLLVAAPWLRLFPALARRDELVMRRWLVPKAWNLTRYREKRGAQGADRHAHRRYGRQP